MWDSFLVAVNAVGPFLILLGLGALIIRTKVADRALMDRLNKLNFRVLFPFMTFNSVYSARPEDMPSPTLIVLGAGGVLLLIGILMIAVPRIVPENPRRGAIIQAIFRSNYVIYGLPLTVSVFGAAGSSITGIMILIMVSLFNIASVVILEYFRGTGKVSLKKLLMGCVKNPLLQGCVAGLIFFALQIRLPAFISSPVASLSGAATTLALIALGASLRFESLRKNAKTITAVLLIRLLLLPAVTLAAAWAAGLRGVELFLILMIYGTPIATASYPMAQSMDSDGELAGQLVFTSTVASLGTIFLFIFLLSRFGLL